MSADLIAAAAGTPAAFDPTPLPELLSTCHVPFAHLIGRPLVSEIGTRLAGYERLALTGTHRMRQELYMAVRLTRQARSRKPIRVLRFSLLPQARGAIAARYECSYESSRVR